ncbi:competence protein ComEA [Candidatus Gottesmanbacteria bacterium CG11_big_fil_rev_8_21_14_0_20_37_11]|uniref:Competence protein ComEA n=3 Tax=Candidatus Gottesmaniibacteriota TaxID=1752720 RepID=A0A2M7RQL2_9BACT|nr:MAG: hypothetical protein AUJ73_04690 [Candidatus Gottesmanbacteria bacterium CG1_02_37_22]PIP32112.1 MAG: competence protein ComEA [Candidatus Gottesmanbacteria bacterium CG23_combo_of_CG06-09_8_20_14_all_37_19]PIR07747.1 MAG: competence protein ComEA [Candidatus Gottesmanbacteria bacterium CG11_big_fil_rev_8_21_14_0_20_37_11]PIZ02611.1 MAG: competence protein ComEA [Candidatus Gottesmanbacteria bacterium CG_4_10_14_0_8_um_filter_37_24]
MNSEEFILEADGRDKDKYLHIFRRYKIPLIVSVLGILFLAVAIVLLVKEKVTSPSPVAFISESSSSASVKIMIDVEGAVVKPGVYSMDKEDRINDVLVLAGGLSKDADRDWVTKYLNRAAKLIDGGKIYIPSVKENNGTKLQIPNTKLQTQQSNLGVTEGAVNINLASQKELESLPGVGEVTAGKIISGRPYSSIDDLKTKKVVGNALFEKIKNLITAY